jgi:hypothetical protein
LPVYSKQQRGITTCLQNATKNKYYMSTTNNKKELLAIHNTQQRGICVLWTGNKFVLLFVVGR